MYLFSHHPELGHHIWRLAQDYEKRYQIQNYRYPLGLLRRVAADLKAKVLACHLPLENKYNVQIDQLDIQSV